jgi:hypothetical protein
MRQFTQQAYKSGAICLPKGIPSEKAFVSKIFFSMDYMININSLQSIYH